MTKYRQKELPTGSQAMGKAREVGKQDDVAILFNRRVWYGAEKQNNERNRDMMTRPPFCMGRKKPSRNCG